MTDRRCTRILPVLPEWIRGDLQHEGAEGGPAGVVERHLEACADCRAEADLLRMLGTGRPEPPPELAGRIKDALRATPARSGGRWGRPRPWGVLRGRRVAAVAAVLVLTTAVVLLPGGDGVDSAGEDVELALESVPDPWLSDDGVVAGAPFLGDLSEEELQTLLEEMDR